MVQIRTNENARKKIQFGGMDVLFFAFDEISDDDRGLFVCFPVNRPPLGAVPTLLRSVLNGDCKEVSMKN